jgi:protein-S-isoprenylcysteine O-methyltransferase Ste14
MTSLSNARLEGVPMVTGNRRALLLDAAERFFVVGLYAWMAIRLLPGVLAGGWCGNTLILLGEGLVVLFSLIRRRTTEISRSPVEWSLAAAATWTPLLVAPGATEYAWLPSLWLLVMFVGLLLQFTAKLALARSFGLVPANRGLKTSGPYRVVRHPMYAGYLLMQVGFLALNPTAWNLAAYLVCWTLQVRRLLAEERFLGRDPAYREYQSRVAYRILPGVF